MEKNIFDPESGYFKKKRKSRKETSAEEKLLKSYLKNFEIEISKTFDDIGNLESKTHFFTPESSYEVINIPDYDVTHKGKKNRNIIFDIQIKNADDYVYEKIIID
jgi:hypothetical protein